MKKMIQYASAVIVGIVTSGIGFPIFKDGGVSIQNLLLLVIAQIVVLGIIEVAVPDL
jgi:hypothetical protein